ncbi:MAG TPA: branched-chain amino acid ABC transporter permease [Noviherbaspirillum sp.]|uniref:branched-chain amino acid ABC transporter permease n=1 Tax=Noviherbaspirillum sp. TaxID=1926288 RepID=UPI002B463CE8|nr:branched-chain amino acid ABC transporter permease [Noviherbaspirillum sp.]HJV87749.1 branched-chain amino acid ABC transporter permease [Noviherbaspirillum sp.]
MSAIPQPLAAPELQALPGVRADYVPVLILVALMLVALPLVGSFPSWVTLTVAGLAMGMMIFLMASGLTLVFGLMDVLNLGHGAFASVGAFAGTLALFPMQSWLQADSALLNLAVLAIAAVVAMLVTGILGLLFERVVIRPVYGLHLKQILITMGGMIIAEQMIMVLWGPQNLTMPALKAFSGTFAINDIAIEKFRMVIVALGLLVFLAMHTVLNRTKAGLLIRAGVENSEMVEALGYRVRHLFIGVFVVGSALAGLGGLMWAMYQVTVTAAMGSELLVRVLIVIVIGGMGSVGGCFVGALMMALVTNYVGFLTPEWVPVADILLMVIILMWRPKGLYPVAKR